MWHTYVHGVGVKEHRLLGGALYLFNPNLTLTLTLSLVGCLDDVSGVVKEQPVPPKSPLLLFVPRLVVGVAVQVLRGQHKLSRALLPPVSPHAHDVPCSDVRRIQRVDVASISVADPALLITPPSLGAGRGWVSVSGSCRIWLIAFAHLLHRRAVPEALQKRGGQRVREPTSIQELHEGARDPPRDHVKLSRETMYETHPPCCTPSP